MVEALVPSSPWQLRRWHVPEPPCSVVQSMYLYYYVPIGA